MCDIINLCKEKFNIFTKEEENKYRKTSIEDIVCLKGEKICLQQDILFG